MSDVLAQIPVELANNHDIASPLRYPGGKSVLSSFVASAIEYTGCAGGRYVEPYSGGAGVALRLLLGGVVSEIVINDLDPAVAAFWDSAVNHADSFLGLFDAAEPTLEEWYRQRDVFKRPCSRLELGFSFFFLNRTCRSGVVSGGVIGGKSQAGRYKVGARYNKPELRKKLVAIADHGAQIEVCQEDGADVILREAHGAKTFFYVDPPYVEKGGSLYMNSFRREDHGRLARVLVENRDANWLLTYDDAPQIREAYRDLVAGDYELSYSAHRRKRARELMAASDSVRRFIESRLREGSLG